MMAIRCAIVEDPASPQGERLLAALRALPAQAQRVGWTAADLAGVDVLLPLVGAGQGALACERLAAWRAAAPGCALLAVGIGLDAARIEALLAAGAADFLALPQAPGELAARVHRVLGLLPHAAAPLPAALADPRLKNFIGRSAVFVQQVARLPTFAGCDAGVLLTGDTGTGKEVCAQAIHYLSARASRPWVAVNCAAIPNELIESELFGHVRGAFTHAQSARHGLVHEAEGGTLFLDDIDCLPLPAQAKLLRFLQEREYRQVGANAVQRADVRVIAASNRCLAALTASGAFRQDLYFRLAVLTLKLPALRERREDIPALALHFIRQCAARRPGAMAGASLTAAALRKLLAHDWPGNVRELKHAIERAVLLARGPELGVDDIDLGDAQPPLDGGTFRSAKARVVQDFERSFIEHLLAAHGGNVTHAAQAAHKNRRAFFELMRKHRIDPARFRAAV